MTSTVSITTIEPMTCSECGVVYGLSKEYQKARRDDHREWWCPNKHSQYFPQESEAEKYKREAKWQKDRAAALLAERDGAQASLRATKGHVTRLRKVVASGACPYGCGRRFAGLSEHIAKVHPDQPLEAEA